MKPVTIEIRWEELFGKSKKDASDKMRRKIWEEWKALSSHGNRPEMVNWWSNEAIANDCFSCSHKDGDWCLLQSLPCAVNPVTTFTLGHIGMACMGLGFKPKQTKMEF